VAETVVTEAVARAFHRPDQKAFRVGVRTSAGLHMIIYAMKNNKDMENFSDRKRRWARAALIGIGAYNLIQVRREF
jgi:hypothetical protein